MSDAAMAGFWVGAWVFFTLAIGVVIELVLALAVVHWVYDVGTRRLRVARARWTARLGPWGTRP